MKFNKLIHEVNFSENTEYYFAYGSNLNTTRLIKRIGDTFENVGFSKLNDYKFFINENGVANIKKSIGDFVEGNIYKISLDDKHKLDGYEGVNKNIYNRCNINCTYNNKTIKCFAYISHNVTLGKPSKTYFNHIIKFSKFSKVYLNRYLNKYL